MIFIYGKEEYLIEKKLNSILKKSDVKPIGYSAGDNIDDIISEIKTISLFYFKKIIIIKDHDMMTDAKIGKLMAQEIVNDKNIDDVEIIFILHNQPKKTNALIKYLFDNAELFEINEMKARDYVNAIMDITANRGGTISYANATLLSYKLPNNLRLIVSEIEKLLMLNLNISKEIIEDSIGEYISNDYFHFSNAVIQNDKNEIIKSYQEKINSGESFTNVIFQLAQTFELSIKIHNYKMAGMALSEVSEKLGVHIYRVKKGNELLMNASINSLKERLANLADLDYKIKSGKLDSTIGLNHFVMNLIK